MSLELVRSRTALRRFVHLPWQIYHRDPYWVSPLLREQFFLLSHRHPFYAHGDAQLFLAWHQGRVVGRIAAIVNRAHNDFHRDAVGFFGFFECIDDLATAHELLEAAAAWLRERGLDAMRGPASYSTNDVCGLLLEGFDSSPCVLMPYNPPYYLRLLEGAGLVKAKDLWAYTMPATGLPRVAQDLARRARERFGVTVRPMNLQHLDQELALVKQVYNRSWEANWGFVPMTDAEIELMARDLRPVLRRDLALLAEADGQPVGFSVAIPDVNLALKRAGGRLLPWGALWLMYLLPRIRTVRLLALGVLPEFRRRGVDALLYSEMMAGGQRLGVSRGELSWVLEDNVQMTRALERLGGVVYKRYRMFERSL
ncbi:MAG: N-acetyltransferase [Deinococcus sp.]|nr:N-acetyltransferase [Deinococcus sp.]